jgi:hypothetical protein
MKTDEKNDSALMSIVEFVATFIFDFLLGILVHFFHL